MEEGHAGADVGCDMPIHVVDALKGTDRKSVV